jgi:iron complex transport system ATP-binding protein
VVLTVEVAHARFSYDGGPAVLDDVSIELGPGDVLWLLGPNGSGKTTLLRCVLGLHRLASGSIHVGGRNVTALTPAQMARELAYVPQSTPAIFPFLASDVVLMGRSPHLRGMAGPTAEDRRVALAAMGDLGFGHLADRRFDQLSGGEQQMVLIARALSQGTRALVMDEPCAGLDYGNQVTILTTLRDLAQRGYSILASSHLPDHALAVGTKVALLKRGRLRACGAPREVIMAKSLSDLYDTAIEVFDVRGPDGAELSMCVPLLPAREPAPR